MKRGMDIPECIRKWADTAEASDLWAEARAKLAPAWAGDRVATWTLLAIRESSRARGIPCPLGGAIGRIMAGG